MALSTAQPKPRPKLLSQRERKAALDLIDRGERQKCRMRSGGQCEVRMTTTSFRGGDFRCVRRASQNHHLIGGSGRRNKGKSILSEHRLETCDCCHEEITHHVLVPVDGLLKEDAATVRYQRIR